MPPLSFAEAQALQALACLLLAWNALETRRVWQALHAYAAEVRRWNTTLLGWDRAQRKEDV